MTFRLTVINMRQYVLIGLRKAAEHVAKKYDNDNKFPHAGLANAVANLLNAENYMSGERRKKVIDIAESIVEMIDSPNQRFVELIQAYREELNRKEE